MDVAASSASSAAATDTNLHHSVVSTATAATNTTSTSTSTSTSTNSSSSTSSPAASLFLTAATLFPLLSQSSQSHRHGDSDIDDPEEDSSMRRPVGSSSSFRCNPFRTIFYGILVFVTVIFVFDMSVLFYSTQNSLPECPLDHATSTAPLNHFELAQKIHMFIQGKRQSVAFNNQLITTTVNEAAARYNLPSFLSSMKIADRALHDQLLIFCLDEAACKLCSELHQATSCMYMDMGLSSSALVPGGGDSSHRDYVRLNYGRVYATVVLTELGVNALPVDVDAIFLKNPFSPGNGIAERPHDIAVVQDIEPFRFDIRDKVPINGGFIYFPAGGKKFQFVREFVNKVWDRNCRLGNEQLVFSSVLRSMYKKYYFKRSFSPYMLSPSQYLNFCSADCGTNGQFRSIKSYEELINLEKIYGQSKDFKYCSPDNRKNWVYFHVACVNFTTIPKNEVIPLKGKLQQALYKWATGADLPISSTQSIASAVTAGET